MDTIFVVVREDWNSFPEANSFRATVGIKIETFNKYIDVNCFRFGARLFEEPIGTLWGTSNLAYTYRIATGEAYPTAKEAFDEAVKEVKSILVDYTPEDNSDVVTFIA